MGVGFLLNPISVLKARYEVHSLESPGQFTLMLRPQSKLYAYRSFPAAIVSLVRAGPSEMFRGFTASTLRDAPYAGIFVCFYENIKQGISQTSM